jgi:hypothetical protein
MLVEVMKFGIGAFKQAEPIEGTLDAALEQMKAASQQPKQPQPDPEQMKMQAQQQSEQMKMQADAQAAQMKAQIDVQAQQARVQADLQIEQMKIQADANLEQMRQQMKMQELQSVDQFNRWKAELESSTRIMVAEIGAKAQVDKVREAEEAANNEAAIVLGQGDNVSNAIQRMADVQDNMANIHGQTMDRIGTAMQMMSAPKRVVRDIDGKVVGVEIHSD